MPSVFHKEVFAEYGVDESRLGTSQHGSTVTVAMVTFLKPAFSSHF